MILRNIFLVLIALFLILSDSFANSRKTIESTASYVSKSSHFYEKDTYENIFLKGIDSINLFSENILVEITRKSRRNLELAVNIEDKKEILNLRNNKNIRDVARNLSLIIEFLKEKNYIEDENKQLGYIVANTILQEIDEYSSIIRPEILEQFLIESKGSFGGLGIVIGIRDERLTIISPIEDTPAFKAGIKANDVIQRIEDFDTEGYSLEQAIKLLRGEKGTPVTIYIERANIADLIRFDITRDIINIESIKSRKLKKNIGYIKVNSFQSNTYNQFLESLQSLRSEGIYSLILDLRGNPGGLFDQALKISNIFLEKKLIVSTKSKNKQMNINFFSNPLDIPKFDGPLIVLVDGGSASASEIVIGAIKNNQRGLILGEKTFGKGTIQEVYKQDDGSAVKLTIAEYLNPQDYRVHLNGISPDINFISVNQEDDLLLVKKEAFNELSPDIPDKRLNIIYTPKEDSLDNTDELIVFSTSILNSELLKKISLEDNVKNFLSLIENEMSLNARNISDSFTNNLKDFRVISDLNQSKTTSYNKDISLVIKKNINFQSGKKEKIIGKINNDSSVDMTNLIIKSESANKSLDNKFFYIGSVESKDNFTFEMIFDLPNWVESSKDRVEFTLLHLAMSDPLRPKLVNIKEASSNIILQKEEFIFPRFSYSIRPLNSKKLFKLNLDIYVEKTPLDCKKCVIKILSKDTNLIIKNKIHKLDNINKKDVEIESILSVNTEEYTKNKIGFTIRFHDKNTHSFFDKDVSISVEELSSFTRFKKNKFYKLSKNSLLLSEPGSSGILIGTMKENDEIEAAGKTNNFVLIESDNEKTISWIRDSNLKPLASISKSNNISKHYEEAPKISVKSSIGDKDNVIKITSHIKDSTNLKNINYFLNEKKIRLISKNEKSINDSFNIKLKPGRNKLYIIASDKKNIKTYKEIFITNNDE
ncbi:MAG: S41 family peptidase [Thermodesulfobacteriota bacterium]|nr:MAG: PDZ domain-containing protein [Candidatus Dadabacteria bacterium]